VCSFKGVTSPQEHSSIRSVTVCCSVLQCVALRCSVLQCVASHRPKSAAVYLVPQRVAACCSRAVCCNKLHCDAVCCSVLLCVAVCYSVMQCCAVWCSVVHFVASRRLKNTVDTSPPSNIITLNPSPCASLSQYVASYLSTCVSIYLIPRLSSTDHRPQTHYRSLDPSVMVTSPPSSSKHHQSSARVSPPAHAQRTSNSQNFV